MMSANSTAPTANSAATPQPYLHHHQARQVLLRQFARLGNECAAPGAVCRHAPPSFLLAGGSGGPPEPQRSHPAALHVHVSTPAHYLFQFNFIILIKK
jgi:hypothetical protein